MASGEMAGAPPAASGDYWMSALLGYAIIVGFVLVAVIGAFFTHLDSAAIASGQVVVDGRRQVVQHLEGGIVSHLAVKEGQAVTAGQTLIELDGTQARADLDIIQQQYDFALAQEARLQAEIASATEIKFPDELKSRASDPAVEALMKDQIDQFTQRSASLESQIAVLKSRESLLHDQIDGLASQLDSAKRQLKFLDKELVNVRKLADEGLVPQQRWLGLEREKAQIEGEIGRNIADQSMAQNSLKEIQYQVTELQSKKNEENYAALNEVRQKTEDLPNRIAVMKERMSRTRLIAPKSGVVQNVKVTTIGQVVSPGDVLLEIVPINENLTVEARVPVAEVDSISVGMRAEVRFPNFHSDKPPIMFGDIKTLSRDRLVDQQTGEPYFLAQLEIESDSIPPDLKARLQAGIPAAVVIPRGERSIVSYLVQPLTNALRTTFRER